MRHIINCRSEAHTSCLTATLRFTLSYTITAYWSHLLLTVLPLHWSQDHRGVYLHLHLYTQCVTCSEWQYLRYYCVYLRPLDIIFTVIIRNFKVRPRICILYLLNTFRFTTGIFLYNNIIILIPTIKSSMLTKSRVSGSICDKKDLPRSNVILYSGE